MNTPPDPKEWTRRDTLELVCRLIICAFVGAAAGELARVMV